MKNLINRLEGRVEVKEEDKEIEDKDTKDKEDDKEKDED